MITDGNSLKRSDKVNIGDEAIGLCLKAKRVLTVKGQNPLELHKSLVQTCPQTFKFASYGSIQDLVPDPDNQTAQDGGVNAKRHRFRA